MTQRTYEFNFFRNSILTRQDNFTAYTKPIIVFKDSIGGCQVQLHEDHMLSSVVIVHYSGDVREVILFNFVTLYARKINSTFCTIERYSVRIDKISFDVWICGY